MKLITQLYKTDVPNRNGHIYSKEVMKNALEEYSTIIQEGKAMGEFGQGIGTDFALRLDKVSHLVTGYEEVENGFVISAKILDTPNGRRLQEMLEESEKTGSKMALSFATRGTGELCDKNIKNFKLVSIDILPYE